MSEAAYKIHIRIRRVTEQYVGALDRIGLLALKNKYDPANLFRLNQNIKPTV
ncbi:MAG: BBE domain-containing protein [Chloroflexota bacterium]|nr:BBE domain-containing protein [Chloroflexota bacterium]